MAETNRERTTQRRLYRLELIGMRGADPAQAAVELAATLGIPLVKAEQLLLDSPATVIRCAPSSTLKPLADLLLQIGAEIRLEELSGGRADTPAEPKAVESTDSDEESLPDDAGDLRDTYSNDVVEDPAPWLSASDDEPEDGDEPLHGVRVFRPPEVSPLHPLGTPPSITGAFEADVARRGGQPGRKASRGLRKLKKRRRKLAFEAEAGDGEAPAARRRRLRERLLIAVALVLGVVALVVPQIELPTRLSHRSAASHFAVQVDGGLGEPRHSTSTLDAGIGTLATSSWSVREMSDVQAHLLFTHVTLSEAIEIDEPTTLASVLSATARRFNADMGEPRPSEPAGLDGLEADFTAFQFSRTYEGRVVIAAAQRDVVILMCQGLDGACQTEPRVAEFFGSLQWEALD